MFMPREAPTGHFVIATLAAVSSLALPGSAQDEPALHNACEADPLGLSLVQLGITDPHDPGKLDHIGHSIAAGGDFNDDGFKDIVLGGYTRSVEGEFAVTPVVVFLGTGNSPPFSPTNPAFKYRLTIRGGATFDLFGFSVAFIGDISGDGIDELVVGAPRFDVGTSLADAGRVSIIFGYDNDDLDPDDPYEIVLASDVQDVVIDGQVAGGWFGASVATARDANGEFLKDLIIGAPGGGPVFTGLLKGSMYQVGRPRWR